MWESGFGLEDLPKGHTPGGPSARQARKLKQKAQEWAETIPNPLNQETGANLYVALQMYTDARCLDARNGTDPDDPGSATSQIGGHWQTETGRTPKELVETCRMVHVMDVAYRTCISESGGVLRSRAADHVWTGGRTYVKAYNPWKGIKAEELFAGASCGRDDRKDPVFAAGRFSLFG